MPQWTFIFPFLSNWMPRDSFPLNMCALVVAVYKNWYSWDSHLFIFPSQPALEALLTTSGHQRIQQKDSQNSFQKLIFHVVDAHGVCAHWFSGLNQKCSMDQNSA